MYYPYPKTKLAFSAFFERLSYDQQRGYTSGGNYEKREDHLYGGDLLLEYTMKTWLILSLGYAHIERNSNLRGGDYSDNRIFFSIKGVLELWKK